MADGALLPGWLLWSLPAMFLLHDAEEVLFLPPWLRRNREWLARRFPQLARRMLLHFDGISPLRFAAMAAEELVLLVAVTACAALAGCYYPWLALFLAFGMHLLIHLGQWAAVGRYVPVIATSLPCLACCGRGLCITDKLPGLFAPGVRVMRDGGMCRRRGQSLARASSGGAARRCMSPGDYFPCLGCCLSRIVCRSAMNLSGLAAPCMRPSSSPCVSKTR